MKIVRVVFAAALMFAVGSTYAHEGMHGLGAEFDKDESGGLPLAEYTRVSEVEQARHGRGGGEVRTQSRRLFLDLALGQAGECCVGRVTFSDLVLERAMTDESKRETLTLVERGRG